MAKGINKVILVGNLGAEPEMRYMPSGSAVANLRIATSETWKDKQSGEQNEHTEWHKVVFFNRLAEIAGEYLHKGSKVYIEGSLKTRKWQGNDGVERYTTEIVGRDMQMLDSRRGATQQTGGPGFEQGNNAFETGSSDLQSSFSSEASGDAAGMQVQAPSEPTAVGEFNDDIPF